MNYDIVVIGGGPGGYVAAIKAAQMGKSVCIIEKDTFGGTCLNVGCIPAKALLKSVEILNEVKHASDFGVKNIEVSNAELDMAQVQKRKNTLVNQLVSGIGGLMKKNNITVIKGEGSFVDKNTIMVADRQIQGESIIIATGSSVKLLPLQADPGMTIYTSTDILDLENMPTEIVIIGGGVIGIELAYYLSNIGVKVKIVEFMDRILSLMDQEITDLVSKQFHRMGIEIHTNAKVTKIDKAAIELEQDGKTHSLNCDAVLMAVGRQPNIEGLKLEAPGVKVERGAIVSDDHLATNVKGIYAVGDVNGKLMLAHTASMEAIVAVEHICGIDSKMEYDMVPSAIFIKPEIASIGLTEEQAKEKYTDIKVGRFPMMANGKAKIEGETRGFVKVITKVESGEILGAHLACTHAADMISEFSLALKMECTAEEIARAVHPHPSLSEAIHEACHAAAHKAIHL